MIRVVGIIISVIYFLNFGEDTAYQIKKATVIKIHKGLPSLTSFTKKYISQKNIPKKPQLYFEFYDT